MIVIKKNSTFQSIALHLFVWGILFGFPIFFTPPDTPLSTVYVRTLLPLFFTAFVFYINYFLLIDRILFTNQLVLFVVLNLVLILGCTGGQEWLKDFIWETPYHNNQPHNGRGGGGGRRVYYLFRMAFSMALTVGVSVATRITQRWAQSEAARKNLETEQLKSTLAHLQYQIQPHFFFNSLNNIYALIDTSPEKAKESVHGLSKLMRYLLYEAKAERVILSNEIIFLKNYIQLMHLRLTGKVEVKYDFPELAPNLEIAPLLFIPLVENAFKHGVSASQPSFIAIKMEIVDKQIRFWVENTNFPKNDSDQGGSGIGIENLKKRLELLYPDHYKFSQEVENNTFRSKLNIDIE